MPRRKTRTRLSELAAACGAALLLAGCGSGTDERAAPQPRFPREVATSLARTSDSVAAALAANDVCRARALGVRLQSQAIAAINTRRVPAALLEPLQTTINDIVDRIPPCVQRGDEDDDRNGHGKGKEKGKGKNGKRGGSDD